MSKGSKKSSAVTIPAFGCKQVLALMAEMIRSPNDLKVLAGEIIKVLAKDVLLSQIHQGKPIENADIGAFDRFYASERTPPHVYLTLIQVSGWASHDDDPQTNAERVSGPNTEGHIRDGQLCVSLLTDTQVSRLYMAEDRVPENNETIPFLRGDPIPVIAGHCSAADLWCALEKHRTVARLPDTLQKRGWKKPMLAIFKMGERQTSTQSSTPQPAESEDIILASGSTRRTRRHWVRPPRTPTVDFNEDEVRRLKSDLSDARDIIISLMPTKYAELLRSYIECKSTSEFHRWKSTVAEKLVELVPPGDVVESWGDRRINCPLCGNQTSGPFPRGFAIPKGLIQHLTGHGNAVLCDVSGAAFALGREYVQERFGESERGAAAAAKEEEERLRAARRKTETIYKFDPLKSPELVDDGYGAWLEKTRDPESLAWAEARALSLGFNRSVEANVLTLSHETKTYIVYADIRIQKKITFRVFELPIPKSKRVREADFTLPDYFKHDLRSKYDGLLKVALTRTFPRKR